MAHVEQLPDGTYVLHDPMAVAMVGALGAPARQVMYDGAAERIRHFEARMRGPYASRLHKLCIVLIDVDDRAGKDLVPSLMPHTDWHTPEWNDVRTQGGACDGPGHGWPGRGGDARALFLPGCV